MMQRPYHYRIGRVLFFIVVSLLVCVKVADAELSYFVYDKPGRSVVQLTDTVGNVNNSYEYDAFGNISIASENTRNDFTYVGEHLDKESGLIYLRSRYYDPQIGRFITKDPLLDADRVLWYLK